MNSFFFCEKYTRKTKSITNDFEMLSKSMKTSRSSVLTPSTDSNSRSQESEWKEKAKVELEEWHSRQNEQLEKTKSNNR